MNNKGQAALIDSLFFITIVSSVCTALFYFAINYGLSSEDLLESFYSQDFAMDSLKVVTYINIFRDGKAIDTAQLENNNAGQLDYLLALIKEDYVKNKEITIQTKTAIANTLHSVLRPFDSSIDYIFFIAKEGYKPGEEKYRAMIVSTRQCVEGCEPDSSERVINRVYYSCNPELSNILEKQVFPYAGQVDFAIGKISLIDSVAGGSDISNEAKYTYYIMGLYLWTAKKIPSIEAIVETSGETDPAKREANFNCVLLSTN